MLGSLPVQPLAKSWRALLCIGLYLCAGALVSLFPDQPGSIVLIWPPAGIAFAMLLLEGRRYWPLIGIGVLLLHWLLAPVPLLFLPFSVTANILAAVTGVSIARLLGPLDLNTLRVRTGFRLLAGGIVLAATSALIGVSGLAVAEMSPWAEFVPALAKWMMGDVLGVAALTPTLLIAARVWRRGSLSDVPVIFAPLRERLWWLAALVPALLAMLILGQGSSSYALGLSSLPLMLLLWSALRFEPLITGLATALLVLSATTMAGLGYAGFSPPSSLLETAILLVFMTLLAVIPLIIAAATYESRVAAYSLVRRASSDRLTGLPNRMAFEDQVERQLALPESLPLTLLYIDLDQFKLINDTVSHADGDRLLRRLANLLSANLRSDEYLARLGGDEFGLVLCRQSTEQAQVRAEAFRRLIRELREPAEAHVLSTTASIGLVTAEHPGSRYAALLAAADAACFHAKEHGGDRIQCAPLSALDAPVAPSPMHWAMRLQQALEESRIELYAQSIVPTRPVRDDQPLRRIEVLLRLRDADEDYPASQVVAAAERFQLAARLDRYIIDRCLDWFDRRPQIAGQMHTVSINLSAQSLAHPELVGYLRERLQRSRLPASSLCFEITETAAIRDLHLARKFIGDLRALGCRFALDDFGSGFCSFAYLPQLDVDYFKIDGSFVRDIEDSALALSIVRAIAEIARSLGKLTVAECAESDAIRARVALLGVDFVQGYAIDRPRPLEEMLDPPGRTPVRRQG